MGSKGSKGLPTLPHQWNPVKTLGVQSPSRDQQLLGPRGAVIQSLQSSHHLGPGKAPGLARPKLHLQELHLWAHLSQNSTVDPTWECIELVYAAKTPADSTFHPILHHITKKGSENF